MARAELVLPDNVHYATKIRVRVTDVNYGAHLGNDSVLGLLHEARIRFLEHYGQSEANLYGVGLIMSDSLILYRTQARMGEMLVVGMTVAEVRRSGFNMYYRVTARDDGREVARACTGLVCFDYQQQKPAKVPEPFKALFEPPTLIA